MPITRKGEHYINIHFIFIIIFKDLIACFFLMFLSYNILKIQSFVKTFMRCV